MAGLNLRFLKSARTRLVLLIPKTGESENKNTLGTITGFAYAGDSVEERFRLFISEFILKAPQKAYAQKQHDQGKRQYRCNGHFLKRFKTARK